MNGPEILHLIRRDLQRAVTSPWVTMSAMQKAIRPGRVDLAPSCIVGELSRAPGKCRAADDLLMHWRGSKLAPRSEANGRLRNEPRHVTCRACGRASS